MLPDLLKSSVIRWARRGKLVVPTVDATPSSPIEGEMWIDSTLAATRQARVYSGGAVRDVEIRAEKDAANGYVGLDGSGKQTVSTIPFGATASTVCEGNDARLLVGLEPSTRIFTPQLVNYGALSGAFTLVSGKAAWCYLGRMPAAGVIPYVKVWLTAGAAGVTAIEIGLFSGTNGPTSADRTMTLIEATATLSGVFTSGSGIRYNNAAFTTSMPEGTHVYAGIRETASAGGASVKGCGNAFGTGALLALAGAASFTGGTTTWAAAVVAEGLALDGPLIWAALDAG